MNNFCTVLCCGTSGAAWLHHTATAPHLHSKRTHSHFYTDEHQACARRPDTVHSARRFPVWRMQQAAKKTNKNKKKATAVFYYSVSSCFCFQSLRKLLSDAPTNWTKSQARKNPLIPKLSPEVDFKNLNSGFVAFKFKAGKEKKRCWNVSFILKWQTCWCGDLYVLWLKGWGAAGQMSRGYKLTSEWKGRGSLGLWFPVLLMPLKSHFKAGRL